jgi:phosphatidylinositol alpha-mannosyltransferase
MKIGLICPYNMFQFAGGVQEIVLQLQKHLQKKGHQAIIITPRPRAHLKKAPKDMILLGRSAKMNTPFSTMVDFGFEADGDEIEDMIEREKFDVLHFHEPWVPLLSRQILSRSNSINVATFHATPPETVVSKSLLSVVTPYTKSVLAYLHAYTAVSESAAEYVKSLTKEPITIVPNGIDISYFKPSGNLKKDTKKTILYLGRLERRKGVKYLIDAYALLRQQHSDVKLVIAGSGVKRKSLERYTELYEIPDVSFIGFVPEKEKVDLMASADLYCSPAPFGESFGIVLLEAMAVGTPVVAGNNPGYASVMTDLGRISLVTPRITIDFAQRLELMLYNEQIRSLWKQWANIHLKQFSFDKVTEKYEKVYNQAIKVYA